MNTDEFGRPVPSGVLKIKHESTRAGRCYELACRTLLRTPVAEGWKLVHGNFRRPDGTRYGHAWLVSADGRHLYCAVWNRTTTMDYANGSTFPRVHTVYTAAEARAMLDLTGHYGPTWPLARKVAKK